MSSMDSMTDDQLRARIQELGPEAWEKLGASSAEEAFDTLRGKGRDGIMADARNAMAEEEGRLAEVVALAHNYISDESEREMAVARFYGDALDDLTQPDGTVDYGGADNLFVLLTIACFKLAEAEVKIAALQDGGHRTQSP